MERLTDRPELIDGDLDAIVLRGSLRDLARVNRWLGGVALSRSALIALASGRHSGAVKTRVPWRDRPLTLLDVGTGAADIPAALLAWTRARGRQLSVEATDDRREVVDLARELTAGAAGLELTIADARGLDHADGSFDVAHSSLVLHHLEPEAVVGVLAEMRRVSRIGVIVNDLERGRFALFGAWVLSHALTRNRYTRHDAALSVRRAYRADEIRDLARLAGLVEVARFPGFLRYRFASAFVAADGTRG